ncbi:NYN domain-containing protein [Amaricoccus sp.]|uniref:NYN domain-containing protein n=1 Tax=Amaricoccus sp. TaxID=1872485 RepID=UPI001B5EDFD7|nr:NYN domain-containing protein [Amaricoccus sp.]MBP7002450.1 NYN domain-containing protein [Amaricoccus sp.]
MRANQTLALLIDGDNVSSKVVCGLLAEVATYGTASVKRIYGDWTQPNLSGWKDCLLEHSIQPVQQFAYVTGKNTTDGAMIIDAMDLLHTGRFSGFCIVSSDSDFTRLAARVREQGITVYGFGERKTPRSFVTACDRFVYFDLLAAPRVEPGAERGEARASGVTVLPTARLAPAPAAVPLKAPLDRRAIGILAEAIRATAGNDGRANLCSVGAHLSKQAPGFDARKYGFARLSDLVKASGIVEVELVGQGPIVVRLKADSHKAVPTSLPAAAAKP